MTMCRLALSNLKSDELQSLLIEQFDPKKHWNFTCVCLGWMCRLFVSFITLHSHLDQLCHQVIIRASIVWSIWLSNNIETTTFSFVFRLIQFCSSCNLYTQWMLIKHFNLFTSTFEQWPIGFMMFWNDTQTEEEEKTKNPNDTSKSKHRIILNSFVLCNFVFLYFFFFFLVFNKLYAGFAN